MTRAALSLAALYVVATTALALASDEEPALDTKTEINRKVTNPVSATWSLKLENDVILLDLEGHGDQVQNKLTFQPTMPVWLTTDLKLIARPEFTLLDSKPYVSNGDLRRATGLGDTVLDLALSPRLAPWLLGFGPTFVFPTATTDRTGNGKWEAGPAGVFGYEATRWLAGVIAQQWWSFAGESSRPAVSELHLQYIASYFFGDGWSVGTEPTIKFNWRATAGDQVTFPFGPFVAKVVRLGGELPVKLELQALYVPVHPDKNGEQFQLQIRVTPVVPSPLRGPLFGG